MDKADLSHLLTVREYIALLEELDGELPLVVVVGEGRIGEYHSPYRPEVGDLIHQDTSGDPELYGSGTVAIIRG